MSNDGDSDSASESKLPPAKRQKVDQGPSQCDQQGPPQEVPEPIPSTSKEGTGLENKSNVSNDEFNDFVTPEEVEKLREFSVLDEVKSNDEDSNGECDDSDSSSAESGELPEEEIEKMLEEDLPEGFKAAPKPKEKPYVTREKVILEEKGVNHFEVLPLDWIMIRHQSGMPVYVHRATRVCTLSKPYFLGKGNAKRHDIPISAIPCLAYRRALQEEEKQKLIDQKVQEQIKLGTWKKQTDNNAMKLTETGQSNNPCKSEEANSGIDITEESTANVKDSTSLNGPDEVKSESLCPYKRGVIISSNTVCPNSKLTSEINGNSNEKTSESSQSNEELVDANATNSKMEVANDDVVLVKNATEIPTSIELSSNKTKDLEQTDKNDETNDESGEKSVGQIKDESDEKSVGQTKDESGEKSVSVQTENKNCEESNETAKNDIEIPDNRQPIVLPGGIVMPSPRVETVNTSWKTQHLTHEQVTEYCKKLFKFKILNIMHFKCWADRRKYTKARKALQYPMLPEGTKLITIPAQQSLNGTENANGSGKTAKRDWVMNMNGRSYLSVFHEYVRRALQKQPVYEFKQLENASMPYQATVYIGGMQYGVGRGSSKRQAKSAAARESIHILIPEMKDHLEPDNDAEPDFVFFDYVGIEDPRITEFCAATCEPTPHAILRTCLLRNFGAGDRHIHTEMKKLEYQKIELTMRVGKHSATVVCKNKKTAKQRASQAILQALHPHVRSWGSLLRLYGSRSVKSCKEKKLEEQQITLLQDKARHNEPNYAVLEKLRNEMRKLRERDAAVVPIGTLLLAAALPAHSGSNLNTVDL